MSAAVSALETFQARVDQAIANAEIRLSRIVRERGYLLEDDRIGFMTAAIPHSMVRSLADLECALESAARSFVKQYGRKFRNSCVYGLSFHQTIEYFETGTRDWEACDAAQFQKCVAAANTSDIWLSTLNRIAADSPVASTQPGKASPGKRGRPAAARCDGERIRSFRDHRELSQAQFVLSSRISVDTLQRAEDGHATDATLEKIARRMSRLSQQAVTAQDLKIVAAENRKK